MKIAFCGDLLLQNPEQHTISDRLQSKLNECEIRVLNFEAPIKNEKITPIHKSGATLCQSPTSVDWVRNNGFNLISLANNHAFDYGEDGLKATMQSFDSTYITGVGSYESAYNICIVSTNEGKIGFMGVTHQEFGCVGVNDMTAIGTAMATSPKVFSRIANSRKYVDKLYMLPHAGVEYLDTPLPEWREVYKSYIELGADGVFASHPHVPQGWEIYMGKPIFYSLGNFLFEKSNPSKMHSRWFNSLLITIDTTTNNLFNVTPIIYDPITKLIDIDTSSSIQEHLKYLNSLLTSHEAYSKYLEEKTKDLSELYKIIITKGGGFGFSVKEKLKNILRPVFNRKVFKPDSIHLLNLYQCESHRWMMIKLLKSGFFD